MKSKASFNSHPIHPILINFPIAFFTGTLIFDIIGLLTVNYNLHYIAFYLSIAGCIGAVLAAVFGLIDFLYTVPPRSSAKKRAAKHGLLNTGVLVLFIISIYVRQGIGDNLIKVLIIELIAVGLLLYAGYLGGTLVFRNQIGVDPRYAWAGKWKEISIPESNGTYEVAREDELKTNQMKLIRFKNKRIVLGRTEEGYFAFDDQCSHRGGSLAGGALICGTVQCPWHGSQFNIKNGEVSAGPATHKISTYPVQNIEGKILVTL